MGKVVQLDAQRDAVVESFFHAFQCDWTASIAAIFLVVHFIPEQHAAVTRIEQLTGDEPGHGLPLRVHIDSVIRGRAFAIFKGSYVMIPDAL